MRASGRGRERCGCPGSGAWALPAPDPLAVLAVHGLLGDAEPPGDVLPGPPELPRVLDLDDLQPLGARPQPAHQPHSTRTGPRLGVRPLCALEIRSVPLRPASALRAEPSAPFLISPPQPEGEIRSGADGKSKESSLRPERGKPQGILP